MPNVFVRPRRLISHPHRGASPCWDQLHPIPPQVGQLGTLTPIHKWLQLDWCKTLHSSNYLKKRENFKNLVLPNKLCAIAACTAAIMAELEISIQTRLAKKQENRNLTPGMTIYVSLQASMDICLLLLNRNIKCSFSLST